MIIFSLSKAELMQISAFFLVNQLEENVLNTVIISKGRSASVDSKDLEGTCKCCVDEQCVRFENIALDFSTLLLCFFMNLCKRKT